MHNNVEVEKIIAGRKSVAKLMRFWPLYIVFRKFVFRSPKMIVRELTERPSVAFLDIMEQWRSRDPELRSVGRARASIRIIRFYHIRDENYYHLKMHYPFHEQDFVDNICNEIEKLIHHNP